MEGFAKPLLSLQRRYALRHKRSAEISLLAIVGRLLLRQPADRNDSLYFRGFANPLSDQLLRHPPQIPRPAGDRHPPEISSTAFSVSEISVPLRRRTESHEPPQADECDSGGWLK